MTDLRTPCVLVEHERLERNLDRDAGRGERARAAAAAAREDAQVAGARRECRSSAAPSGICCAKLGEAEVFADAGIEDIRLPYPLNPANADRVFALAERDPPVVHRRRRRRWRRRGRTRCVRAGRELDVLVKVDVGFHRCGIDPDAARRREIVRAIAAMPGLRFRGLLSHAGHGYGAASEPSTAAIAGEEAQLLRDLAARVRDPGVPVEEISVGATPTARFCLEQEGLTELRPGNYVYYDRTQVALGAAAWDDCALTVLARVVSRPAPIASSSTAAARR